MSSQENKTKQKQKQVSGNRSVSRKRFNSAKTPLLLDV